MTVTGRKHNADDIIATVLAVEPMRFIYRGRIAVFSIRVLRDERICVIAEQRPECSEEEVRKKTTNIALFADIFLYLILVNFYLCRVSSGCLEYFKQSIQSTKSVFIA